MAQLATRSEIVSRLTTRTPDRTEADIQANIATLLTAGGLNLQDEQVRLESPSGDGTRRRLDVEIGFTAIEVKKDLRVQTVLAEGVEQLAGYLRTRAAQTGASYTGILTDGVIWRLYHLTHTGAEQVASLDMSGAVGPERLVAWLEAVLATQTQVRPTPEQIERRLGSSSPAHLFDIAELHDLYTSAATRPEVELKKALWAKLLRTAFGDSFDDSENLFISHTLLVLSAEIVAHAAVGFDVTAAGGLTPHDLASGRGFHDAQILGVVQLDFFDWVLDVPGGLEFIAGLARRIGQFDWSQVEHDVLKTLYASVVSAADREALGEVYTPDWLAERMVDVYVTDPLNQRVADVASGSGTFIFHAIKKYLAAAEAAGLTNGEAVAGVTSHVLAMDVHPVATTIARVTYLLAIGRERLVADDRPPLVVPVFLGDSLQWDQRRDLFMGENQLVVSTTGSDLATELSDPSSPDLVFPRELLSDASTFDRLVEAMAGRASDTSERTDAQVISPVLSQFGISGDDATVLTETYGHLRALHRAGRDTIWSYYVRNLLRPSWLAEDDNKVDVLIGNPPWLAYAKMTASMKPLFTQMLRQRGLISGGAGLSRRDLSNLFAVRAVELYLKPGGTFALVMPHGTLTRQPSANFRSGNWNGPTHSLLVQFGTPWDLHEAATGFPTQSCVINGVVAAPKVPMPATVELWKTRGSRSDVSWAEMEPRLTIATGQLGVTAEDDGASTFSPYREKFRQGAVLAPRMLTMVVKGQANPLGAGAGRVAVTSRKTTQDKVPWKDLPAISATVEREFVRPVHLGESTLPFRLLEPREAVIPESGGALLTAAQIDSRPGLASWWNQAEAVWAANKSRNDPGAFLDRINYIGQLAAQFPAGAQRVVYSKAGHSLCSARVTDTNVVIDHKLYWAAAASEAEAKYLTGILNSKTVLERVRPFQAIGLFGARDFDKNVFRAKIQPFEAGNADHLALVDVVTRAEELAATVDVSTARTFQQARALVTAALDAAGLSSELEALVLRVVPV